MNDLRKEWDARYESGDTPWDSGVTPPEVAAFLASGRLPANSRALDLGCGTGTNVASLARHGLHAVGVEHAGLALAQARRRMSDMDATVRRRVQLLQADVARLPLHGLNAGYVLDIGCLHGVPSELRPAYAHGVLDNIAPGGYYHLFAFDLLTDPPPDRPSLAQRGMVGDEVEILLCPALETVEIVHGNPDHYPCRWYLLRRPG